MYTVNYNSTERQKTMASRANTIRYERRMKESFRIHRVSIRLFNVISGQLSANV